MICLLPCCHHTKKLYKKIGIACKKIMWSLVVSPCEFCIWDRKYGLCVSNECLQVRNVQQHRTGTLIEIYIDIQQQQQQLNRSVLCMFVCVRFSVRAVVFNTFKLQHRKKICNSFAHIGRFNRARETVALVRTNYASDLVETNHNTHAQPSCRQHSMVS